MQTRSWDDKSTGEKKYRTEIIADRTQFGPKGGAVSGGGSTYQGDGPKSQASVESSEEGIDYPEEDINPEDIPF